MKTINFPNWILGALVASLITLAIGTKAEADQILSDELLITDIGGPVPVPIFDFFIPESAPPGPELDLTWVPGVATPVAIPIPPLTAIGLPGASIVVLLEPPGELPEPGEVPISVLLPDGQQAILSDVVISTLGVPQTAAPAFVSLLSDGHPDLPAIAPYFAYHTWRRLLRGDRAPSGHNAVCCSGGGPVRCSGRV